MTAPAPAPLSNAGVYFPPPFIFGIGLVAAWALDRYWHALPLSGFAGSALKPLGWILLALGVILAGWGMATFRRAKTAINPHRSASQLVTHGPYRFTRNPMYTGLTLAYLGGTALLNSAWPIILLPIVLVVLVRRVISREEAYLRQAFSADYTAYSARVRRWL
jgi:protein-S-isoprenylcysteine O-methyltransferase Ste14